MGHFIEIYSRRMRKMIEHIPPETVSAFTSYSWPGNIRELQNMVERAVILSNDGVLHNPIAKAEAPPTSSFSESASESALRESERALIMQMLESVGWVVGGAKGAAAKLGVKRTTLVSKMKRLGVSKMGRFGIANDRTIPVNLPRSPSLAKR
jgi:DNA-binding NtrC family response regulator